ncbi:hypothetical protein [Limnovirga soli]|jgi:hypothetical protein|uniref:hypothetical protein n=1 Tax=Limnovirga soli TaxID=2656915 RepID=UPI00149194BF|nr:hypothetical protein [Limnovirga soli]
MAKAKKTKTPKKAAPASGMVVKSTAPGTYAKASSFIANKNFSSAKKGGITSTPRKAK